MIYICRHCGWETDDLKVASVAEYQLNLHIQNTKSCRESQKAFEDIMTPVTLGCAVFGILVFLHAVGIIHL